MGGASVSVEEHGMAVVLHLEGDLRSDHVPDVHRALQGVIGDQAVVVVDLAGVEHIDSSGIAALIGISKRMNASSGGRLVLCGAGAWIAGVFHTMKIDRLFPLYADVSSALLAEGRVDRQETRG